MSDYDRTMQLVDVATNSAGRANEQFAKYADTVEYRVNKLKNTWEAFRTSIVDSEQVKGLLDITRTVLTFATSATNSYSKLIPTLITVFALFQKIKKVIPTAKNITNAFLEAYKNPDLQAKFKVNGDEASQKIENSLKEGGDYVHDQIKSALVGNNPTPADMAKASKLHNDTAKGPLSPTFTDINGKSFTPSLTTSAANDAADKMKEGAKSVEERLKAGASKVGDRLKTIAPYITKAAATITSSLMVAAKVTQSYEDAQKADKELLSDAVESLKDDYNTSGYKLAESQTKSLKDAKETIEELSSQTYLSEQQTEKLNESITLMREKYPEMIQSYDENTGKIVLLGDKIDKAIEVQEENNKNLLAYQLGQIAAARGNAYSEIQNRINNNDYTTSGIGKFVNENTSAVMTGEIVGGALYGLGGSIAAGAAMGTTLGPIGTAIGAAIGTVVGTISAILTGSFAESTTTLREFVEQVAVLDGDTQKQIFDKINEQYGQSIVTFSEFSSFLEGNENELSNIGTITSDILEEIKNKAYEEDKTKAIQQALVSGTYGENKEKITEQEAILLHSIANTDFEASDLYKAYDKEKASGYDSIIPFYDPDVMSSSNFKETQAQLRLIGQADWFNETIKNIESLDKIPAEFDDLNESQKNLLSDLKDVWKDIIPSSGISDIDDYYQKVEEGLLKIAFGKAAQESAEKKYQEALDQAFNDKSGIYEEAREWVDATSKTSHLTLEQFIQQRDDMVKKVQSHKWSSDAEIQKLLVKFITSLVTGVAEGVDEIADNSSTGIERKLANNYSKLKEYFADSLINSLSIETNNALESVMSKTLSSGEWDKIYGIIENQFNNIPSSLSDNAKTTLQNYTVEQLIGENFDPLKMGEYHNKISTVMKSTKEATKYLSELYAQHISKDVATMPHTFEEISTAMDDTTKSTKNLLSSWQTFFKVWENSLTSTGASSTDILSLGENPLIYSVGEDGLIDLNKAYSEYDALLEGQILQAESEYRMALDAANGDEALINQAKQSFQSNLTAIKTEILNLDDELAAKGEEYKKKLEKASQAYRKALDDERKAEKKLTEVIKEQNEAYNGSDTWVAQVSGTFELDNAYQRLAADAEMYNLKLKEAKDLTDALALSSQKNQNLHEQDVNNNIKLLEYQAADKAILANINKLAAEQGITDPFNMTQIYNDKVPDSIRDRIVKMLETHENYNTEMQKLEKESLEREQKYNEDQKALLDKRVKFLQDGANIMKEAAEKEVKDLKNKYEAMKDADDQYLDALEDAIKRQRNLREREKEANDLAQKEKKLSLISRDTSGANERERLKLEKELQTDRQKYLDNTVDDIIGELKRQSEEREKERQAVVDATEAINESTNWVQQFCSISENWTTQAEVAGWFDTMIPALSVNKTPEEIQQMQNNLNQSWTEQLPYLALSKDELTEFTKATMDEVVAQQENYHTTLQEMEERTTQKALDDLQKLQENADDAAASAQDALTTAQETVETTKKELDEANTVWQNYLADTKILTSDYMKEMVNNYVAAIDEMLKKNAEAGLEAARQKIAEQRENNKKSKAEQLLDQYNSLDSAVAKNEFEKTAKAQGYSYVDGEFKLNDIGAQKLQKEYKESERVTEAYKGISDSAAKEAYKNNLLQNGYIYENNMFQTAGLVSLMESYEATGSTSTYGPTNELQQLYEKFRKLPAFKDAANAKDGDSLWEIHSLKNYDIPKYSTDKYLAKTLSENGYIVYEGEKVGDSYQFNDTPAKFAMGGLVNYTGPAWVDGSPTRPEAFLSAEDTRRIGEAAKLLSLSPFFNSSQTPVSSSVGDTSVEININVEQISSDYDVDQLVERVHQDILDAARPTGTPVILRKN